MLSEEREIEELEEEYEDLEQMDDFALEIQEFDDMEGLEDIPEEEVVKSPQDDIIITYGDKIEDEIKNLEEEFQNKLVELESVEPKVAIKEIAEVLNRSKMLEAHALTAEIASHIAYLLDSAKRFNDATEYCLLAVSESRKSGDNIMRLKSLNAFGKNLTKFDLKDASVIFSQAIELAEELGDQEALAENTVLFANCISSSDRELSLKLYNQGKQFYESTSNQTWLGKIDFRLGLLYLESADYTNALVMLLSAEKYLANHPEIKAEFKLEKQIKQTRLLQNSGLTLKYRLKIPNPEIIDQTNQTRKIYELLSLKTTFDVIKGIRTITNVQELTGEQVFDSLKGILDGSHYQRLGEKELRETADLYEEVGNLFVKDGKIMNGYFNFVAAQVLHMLIGNSKKADKNEKKLLKIIEEITNEEESALYHDLHIYLHYQIALGIYIANPKSATSEINLGIDLARKRDNPYYEARFKEIYADIRKEKNVDKSLIEYQAAISIYESLEGNLDLLRIYEKLGSILLSSQTDKAKEYLKKALEIAEKIENQETISRIQAML